MTDIVKEMKYNHILRDVCCKYISQEKYDFIKEQYSDSTRHYHNWTHIVNVADYVHTQNTFESEELKEDLLITAFLHDAIYKTTSLMNEVDSALLVDFFNLPDDRKKRISETILFTQYKRPHHTEFERIFRNADLDIFNQDVTKQLEFEKQIFQEYFWVPIPMYVEKRIEILKDLNHRYGCETEFLINYLQSKTWNIGFYPGTFYPFHLGHQSIVKQSESMFDKVIIGFGNVNDKTSFKWDTEAYGELNASIKSKYETVELKSLITQNIKDLNEYANVTVIRGLRNGTDLIYEQNYLQSVRDFMPEVKFAYFMTEPQLAHVSSSLIREILKHSPKDAYKYYKL